MSDIYALFNKSEDKRFNYIEKVDDYYIGATFDQGFLIFIKQLPWFTKDEVYAAFKRIVTIIKNDINNFFI